MKIGGVKASPKNGNMITAPNMQNTTIESSEGHQASGQVSTTSNTNRMTKYSPMRKPDQT